MNIKTKEIIAPKWYAGLNDAKEIVNEKKFVETGKDCIGYGYDNVILSHIIEADTEEELDNLIANFEPYPWLYNDRAIRVVVSDAVLKVLSTNLATSDLIPYVNREGIPVVQTVRGLEIYLNYVLPMPGIDDVQGALTQLGCKFETK